MSSHEKAIRNAYGEDIFERLKREMLNRAKTILRFDRQFINEIKAEIRDDGEDEIKEELRIEIRKELEVEIMAEI